MRVKCPWDISLLAVNECSRRKKKEGISGSKSAKYKACLIAKDYNQKEGVNSNEVLSSAVNHTFIHMFLEMVSWFDLELEKLNVKTVFLHGELEEQIFMHQPEEFVIKGKEDYVCKLEKSLYDMKHTPRQWYLRFDTFMIKYD